jgi:hypothetical protein
VLVLDSADIAVRLEVVDDQHHPLLRDPPAASELGEPRSAASVDVEEHRRIARAEVRIAALVEPLHHLRREDAVALQQKTSEIRLSHDAHPRPHEAVGQLH